MASNRPSSRGSTEVRLQQLRVYSRRNKRTAPGVSGTESCVLIPTPENTTMPRKHIVPIFAVAGILAASTALSAYSNQGDTGEPEPVAVKLSEWKVELSEDT